MKEPQQESTKKPNSEQQLHIVGIGTSAGGLEALQALFDYLPAHNNLAYVMVQHLSPDYKSLMVELLSKHTEMPVYQIKNGMEVQGGSVYVMPPKFNLTIKKKTLYLTGKDPLLNINFPIDIFFHALAKDQQEQAIAVILSGTGTDGTRGIKTIKENGGIIMVQDPGTAKFNGMPLSAISTQLADYILGPADLARNLVNLINISPESVVEEPTGDRADSKIFANILKEILRHTGIDFNHYKRNTLYRRLERRMKLNGITTISAYYQYIITNLEELHSLQKDILIGVTQFFRDTEAFQVLEKKVIPNLFQNKRDDEVIRVWTPGCSSGEEAYSIMMLFEEYKAQHNRKNPIKLFATDIDSQAIEVASLGRYPVNISIDVSKERINKFFTQKDRFYGVIQDLRNQIVFARHNIFSDPPFNRVDMIVCRNLLIYLDTSLQKKIQSIFQFALNKDGYLFLGPSESIGDSSPHLKTINKRWKIYQLNTDIKLFNPDMLYNSDRVSKNERARVSSLGGLGGITKVVSPTKMIDQFRDLIVDRFSPMVLFVNQSMEVLYMSGGINRFVRLPEKRLTLNVIKLLPESISLPLNTAIHKVLKEKKPVRYEEISFQFDDEVRTANIQVELLPIRMFEDNLMMVSLELSEILEPIEAEVLTVSKNVSGERNGILEQQLKDTRETLSATIEELETSNEELQASNEELMAANEELQSTNEELQSVNEELHTVNSELQVKIADLTELTDDMDNLLFSIEIGTIFLDQELRIRKFTPSVREQFELMDQDIGRPIHHFNSYLGVDNIVDKATKVLQERNPLEERISKKTPQGIRQFLMRILPYRSDDGFVRGVVITFVDLTNMTK
ncbi:MAG: chemotaxis protein CheB [Bacteroidia bacterium]